MRANLTPTISRRFRIWRKWSSPRPQPAHPRLRASRADGPYSKKVKRLADIPAGAKVAVPSDPTNEGRALKVLEHAGLIKLKDGATLLSGIGDIVSNPKKLKFVELEPALLPRALDDVTAAVINANYALEAGFNPAKNAIALEEKSSPFGNVVAIREGDDRRRPSRSSRRRSPLPSEEVHRGEVSGRRPSRLLKNCVSLK